MPLSRILTEHSLQEIGAAFGGRDHGTVIHACKTVENMMDQDDSIKHSVELLNDNYPGNGVIITFYLYNSFIILS